MIVGAVRGGDAVVAITLKSPEGARTVQAVIDTGFSGHLVLPPDLMTEFGHGFAERAESTLADGRKVGHLLMVVHLRLGDLVTSVPAIEMGSEPLVGMALLDGFRLTIDVTEGGEVAIEPLSTEPEQE